MDYRCHAETLNNTQLLNSKKGDLLNYYDIINIDTYLSNSMIVFIMHFSLLQLEEFIH